MPLSTGIEVKLKRAKDHIATLERELLSLETACDAAVNCRRDEDTGEAIFYLDGLPEIDPELGGLVGDAVHNLRSVLDHLADALVRRYGGTPSGTTQFPIRLAPLPSGAAPGISGCGSLPAQARDALDAVQPYKRSEPQLHQLHIINQLDITDKHSQLLLAVFYAQSASWFGEMEITGFNPGPYQDGDELGRWKTDDAAQSTPSFVFKIGLDHLAMGSFARGNVAQWLSNQGVYYVEQRVLARFEPFL